VLHQWCRLLQRSEGVLWSGHEEVGVTILRSVRENSRRKTCSSAESFVVHLYTRTGHVAAFFGALAARLGAPLAVIDPMLFAFGSAGVTDIGALTAQIMGEL